MHQFKNGRELNELLIRLMHVYLCKGYMCMHSALFLFFLCFPFFSFFFKMHSNDINFYIIESRKTWHNMQLRVLSSIETEIKLS